MTTKINRSLNKIQSNRSSAVTQGTKMKWPYKTDGPLGQTVLMIRNVLQRLRESETDWPHKTDGC
jgi:hypothetical protein